MRSIVVPSAIMAFLVSCSPGNRKGNESGMAEGGAGGLSSRDTLATTSATDSTTTTSSTTTSSTTTNTASAPAAILFQLNVANTAEIQLASAAAKKAASPKVKQIASKLAADHRNNREQLQALAQRLNLDLSPTQGGNISLADSAAAPSDLMGKSGRDFDRAYVEYEITEHEANVQKLQTQAIPSVQNADVKAFLQKTVSEMQSHLSSLQQVKKKLGS
jgi:putative membrane protein